jgi:hypothetical protein
MALPQITKEIANVLGVNVTVLSITTFSNLEVILKILLLVISIAYTVDKWYFQKKKRDGKK